MDIGAIKMEGLIAFAFLVFLVVVVLKICLSLLFRGSKRPASEWKPQQWGGESVYASRKVLYTPTELAFLSVLRSCVPSTHLVMGKVRLADIIIPSGSTRGKEYLFAFNRIAAKHADFVLCERETYRISGVIELDDASHDRAQRIARDKFVDKALYDAGIPIAHIKARLHYDHAGITQQITELLNPS